MTATSPTNSTASTVAILTMLHERLLSYRGPNGATLGNALTGTDGVVRLYQVRVPDNTPYPFAVMRMISARSGEYKGLRVTAQLEIQLYGRPWSEHQRMEALADLIDEAMLFFVRSNDGLTFSTSSTRVTLPPAPAPMDGETVAIRLVYNLAFWPRYLTRITTH